MAHSSQAPWHGPGCVVSKAARRLAALETRRATIVREAVPGCNVGDAARQWIGLPRRTIALRFTAPATRSLALPNTGLAVAGAEVLRRLSGLRAKLPIPIARATATSASPAVAFG